MDADGSHNTYRFGDWLIEPELGRIQRNGQVRHLEPKVLDVLVLLLRRPGEIATQEEIVESVWPGRIIEPAAVSKNIGLIRRALGDDSRQPSYIETIPKRGYRTIAPVQRFLEASEANGRPGGKIRSYLWVAGLVGIFAALIGVWIYRDNVSSLDAITEATSIAVLPFEDISASDAHGHLADGITVELIGGLSDVAGLRVASRTSSFYFKHKREDLKTVGDKLGVDFIVDGTVRVSGDKIRLTVQLVDARDGFEIWSENYDRELVDLFALQTDVAAAIVLGMPIQLVGSGHFSALQKDARNPQAYDLFLQAENLRAAFQSREDLATAQGLYSAAISLDPHLYSAYSGLGTAAYDASRLPGGDTRAGFKRHVDMLETAEALDRRESRPRRDMDRALLYLFKRDWANNELVVRRQLQKDAPESMWFDAYGSLLARSGLVEAGIGYSEAGERIDPLDYDLKHATGTLLQFNQQYDRALTKFNECLDIMPGHARCLLWRAAATAGLGDLESALRLFDATSIGVASQRCTLMMLAGQECPNPIETYYDGNPAANATIAAFAGDYDAVFRWMEWAYVHEFDANFYPVTALLWPSEVREDPRWGAYLDKIGLSNQWRAEMCRRAATLEPVTGINIACPDK